MNGDRRYQIRHAAGQYWLLDMHQEVEDYKAPIVMNETGALILQSFWETDSIEGTAPVLRETYEIEMDEAMADVKAFLSQLKRQGVVL